MTARKNTDKPAKAEKTAKPEKKVRKSKAVREGPKKNQSAYLHFCAEERANIKQEETEISSKQILSEMGARWKSLPEKDDARYQRHLAEAAADKERYAQEKAEYDATKKGTVSEEVDDGEADDADEVEGDDAEEPEVEAVPEPAPVVKATRGKKVKVEEELVKPVKVVEKAAPRAKKATKAN